MSPTRSSTFSCSTASSSPHCPRAKGLISKMPIDVKSIGGKISLATLGDGMGNTGTAVKEKYMTGILLLRLWRLFVDVSYGT